jgi:hypothetical protein
MVVALRRVDSEAMRPRFEPEPSRRRYRWIWPLLVAVVTVGLVGGVLFGGPWYLSILAALLVWGFISVRFIVSERGKQILFSRFDEGSSDDPSRH